MQPLPGLRQVQDGNDHRVLPGGAPEEGERLFQGIPLYAEENHVRGAGIRFHIPGPDGTQGKGTRGLVHPQTLPGQSFQLPSPGDEGGVQPAPEQVGAQGAAGAPGPQDEISKAHGLTRKEATYSVSAPVSRPGSCRKSSGFSLSSSAVSWKWQRAMPRSIFCRSPVASSPKPLFRFT